MPLEFEGGLVCKKLIATIMIKNQILGYPFFEPMPYYENADSFIDKWVEPLTIWNASMMSTSKHEERIQRQIWSFSINAVLSTDKYIGVDAYQQFLDSFKQHHPQMIF